MINVFVYIGSYRENSITREVIQALIESLKTYHHLEDVCIITPYMTRIEECRGCLTCFTAGECAISDDISKIITKLEQCDLFILGSPVYFAQVSGSMKIFLDRISYMTHIFRLSGKLGISVNVSNSNSNEDVGHYLDYVIQCLGASSIYNMSIKTAMFKSSAALRSVIEIEARRISKIISDKTYPISETQEAMFKNYKKIYSGAVANFAEKDYWHKNDYFKYDCFRSLFYDHCSFVP